MRLIVDPQSLRFERIAGFFLSFGRERRPDREGDAAILHKCRYRSRFKPLVFPELHDLFTTRSPCLLL
ncbi:hypothetical protein ACTHPH_19980 [Paenibacillus pasadenensis]|uniref:hypothetical protein n=1 Tax=Paenibacillus TaxID=44249 RepID=UPI000FD8A58E|nr:MULTISPECIES: hypothetical protein [Paenibacillus]QGG54611.1 hypothetical protein GE073_02665 [Paenibacillus sp. B01]